MLRALATNKVDFVKMFIQIGISINSILKQDQMEFLYYYAYHHLQDSMLKKLDYKLYGGDKAESFSKAVKSSLYRIKLTDLKTYVKHYVCLNTARDGYSLIEVKMFINLK